jgi:hypothetical protein
MSGQELYDLRFKTADLLYDLTELVTSQPIITEFERLGYLFTSWGRSKYKDEKGNWTVDVDLMLNDDRYSLAVDVKLKTKAEFVDDHLLRMEFLRSYAIRTGLQRKYIGAIAGAVISESVRDYALKAGFYVLEQTGKETMKIIIPPDGNPKEW